MVKSIEVNKDKALKLIKVCQALDMPYAGLIGKTNLIYHVTYGGIRLDGVRKELLGSK